MLVFWAVNTATWLSGSFGASSLVTDLLFTALAIGLFLASRRRWAAALALLYAADVAIDLAFARGRIDYRAMALAENAIFLAQLAAASWPGWAALIGGRAQAGRAAPPADDTPGMTGAGARDLTRDWTRC